jgi:DNA-nicking Smr family endonuclease
LNTRTARVAFALEKEKTLHRRTCEEANELCAKLRRARTLLYGAAENLSGHGQQASAEALRMSVGDLYVAPRDGSAGAATGAPKDEQI